MRNEGSISRFKPNRAPALSYPAQTAIKSRAIPPNRCRVYPAFQDPRPDGSSPSRLPGARGHPGAGLPLPFRRRRRRRGDAGGRLRAAPFALRRAARAWSAPLRPVVTEQLHGVLRALRPVAAQHRPRRAVLVAPPAVAFGVRRMDGEFLRSGHGVCGPLAARCRSRCTGRRRRERHQCAHMRPSGICSGSRCPPLLPFVFHRLGTAGLHCARCRTLSRPCHGAPRAPAETTKPAEAGLVQGLASPTGAGAARRISRRERLRPWLSPRTPRSGRSSCSGTRWPCPRR
ncbi:hypothetical protein QE399_003536 [Paracidovorax wautersii]|uniref:Uncharacterized protein n=1 Tax=Paracidovorax wautersii TaxID=1177982 RepID=A0ABU1IF81_9BURK|nr:hypothetical protein [Paracidovorax wautersii]